MEKIFKDSRYKSILAIFCALGWSLAYPLIKIGYQEFRIDSGSWSDICSIASERRTEMAVFYCGFDGILRNLSCECEKAGIRM